MEISYSRFFDDRIRKVIGNEGIYCFDDHKEALDIISKILKHPYGNYSRNQDPIWLFRGMSSVEIACFERISNTKCIIDINEFEVDRVVAYVANREEYYRDFIYVETFAEKPTGLYDYEENHVETMAKEWGYYNEEYGEYNGIIVTRGDYDEGYTYIDGEYTKIPHDCKLRCRFLTPYNFIICSKFSPFNSSNAERKMELLMNEIIIGRKEVDDIIKVVNGLERHRLDAWEI